MRSTAPRAHRTALTAAAVDDCAHRPGKARADSRFSLRVNKPFLDSRRTANSSTPRPQHRPALPSSTVDLTDVAVASASGRRTGSRTGQGNSGVNNAPVDSRKDASDVPMCAYRSTEVTSPPGRRWST